MELLSEISFDFSTFLNVEGELRSSFLIIILDMHLAIAILMKLRSLAYLLMILH